MVINKIVMVYIFILFFKILELKVVVIFFIDVFFEFRKLVIRDLLFDNKVRVIKVKFISYIVD